MGFTVKKKNIIIKDKRKIRLRKNIINFYVWIEKENKKVGILLNIKYK